MDAIHRRTIRLLRAIEILHHEGYHNLAIYPYFERRGENWSFYLTHYNNIYIDHKLSIKRDSFVPHERAFHHQGECGYHYFGWDDAIDRNAKALAEVIKERFPKLCRLCEAENYAYVGWFSLMLQYSHSGELPSFELQIIDSYGKSFKELTLNFGNRNEVELFPPHKIVKSNRGQDFIWIEMNPPIANWHTNNYSLIDLMHTGQVFRYITYPSNTHLIFAHGSYWEAAVYYLKTKCQFTSSVEYIKNRQSSSKQLEEFVFIFDSEGQLALFDAHIARIVLKYEKDMSEKQLLYCQSLVSAADKIEIDFPNPYFGGENPLHLQSLES